MRAVAAVVLLMTAVSAAGAQVSQNLPVCRAEQDGDRLLTRIVYPDGSTVEGPWRVISSRKGVASAITLTATLDRVVETDPLARQPRSTLLPSAIEMSFAGETLDELLTEAAHVWCVTVLRVRPPSAPPANSVAASHIT